MRRERLQAVARTLEWPMIVLAILVIPALALEERATSPEIQQAAVALNWVIWLAFCGDFGVRWAADRSVAFPRKAWFGLLLIAVSPPFAPETLQGLRSLRVLRLFRLVRAFGVVGMSLPLGSPAL